MEIFNKLAKLQHYKIVFKINYVLILINIYVINPWAVAITKH